MSDGQLQLSDKSFFEAKEIIFEEHLPVIPADVCLGLTQNRKKILILFRAFGGSNLCYKDQNGKVIQDVIEFYNAERVFFTNHVKPYVLEGHILAELDIPVEARASVLTNLTLIYKSGRSYVFRDEGSFAYWSRNTSMLNISEAVARIS